MKPRAYRSLGVRRRLVHAECGDFKRRLRIEMLEDRRLLSIDLVSTVDPSLLAVPGNGDSNSGLQSISADGRYVAFSSYASNLVSGDTNANPDVFVRDLTSGITTRVSTDSAGGQGNGWSDNPSISADGRYVAFRSYASNLVSGDTNGDSHIFVKDLTTGITTLVSTDSAGSQGNDTSNAPSISADGRYVLFNSYASNLVSGDTNGHEDAFVKDRTTAVTTRVSTDSAGSQGNGNSEYPSISADGRYVAFLSNANNLVSGDTNWADDIFLKDLTTGITTRVSTDSAGNQSNDHSRCLIISADGRYVAFSSYASNLVSGDTNGAGDVFVKDLTTAVTTRVSTDSAGSQGNSDSDFPSISADGRYVAFSSQASNLVSGDTNGTPDSFVKDRTTAVTTRVSTDSAGSQGNGDSYSTPSISADGRYVAFLSNASNLVGGDTNGSYDVFVKDRTTALVTLASTSDAGPPPRGGNGGSSESSISADGRYVAFDSYASDLVGGDTNGYGDVFVRDLTSGITTRVSTDSAGSQGNDASFSGLRSISADGRYVAFSSYASNLVLGDTNGVYDVFVKDLTTAVTTRVSTDSAGSQGSDASDNPVISADGRYVAFRSYASNLVSGDTNGIDDTFVKDLTTGITTLVSTDSAGSQVNGSCAPTSISADGRYVVFLSKASNLVSGDTNGYDDLFVKDRTTAVTTRVSTDSADSQGNSDSSGSSISADGRYVAFQSYADNLVSGDTNGALDTFVKDRTTAVTTRVSTDSAGSQGNGDSYIASISADGRYVAFSSRASNLVSGDTNGYQDIFVKDLTTGITTRVSTDSAGSQGNGDSDVPVISADGRYVAFQSAASNLHPADTTTIVDVFRWNSTTGDIAPPTSVIAFPTDGALYNAAGWTDSVTGTASDSGGGLVSQVQVSIKRLSDNQYWGGSAFNQASEYFVTAGGTTNWSLAFPDSNLTDGVSYTVHAQATDNSSNVETAGPTATFTYDNNVVVNASDSDPGSLRWVIQHANATPGMQTIRFDIPGSGVHTIHLASALPFITDAVVIDGTSQPGYDPGTGVPVIELDGSGVTATGADGLHITAGGSTVKGLTINRFKDDGIELAVAGGNTIQGNYLGTDAAGTADQGNGAFGVRINGTAANTIGGTTVAARNVISGNDNCGIDIARSGAGSNLIAGNLIGTDKTGTADLGNTWYGVYVNNVAGNTLGGTTDAARNVISGNDMAGVLLYGAGATGNVVEGNYIGTKQNGTEALKNASYGVSIYGAGGNTIGGTATGAGNVISGNGSCGVYVWGSGATGNLIAGNLIGTDKNGTLDLGNTFYGVFVSNVAGNTIGGTTDGARNVISGNDLAGVLLSGTGATANVVEGNYIGTKASGTEALKNTSHGVYVSSAGNNTIGGTAGGAGNVISGNGSNGVYITGSGASNNLIAGNLIGTDKTGTLDVGNSLYGVYVFNVAGNTIGGTTDAARNVISGNNVAGVLLNWVGATGNVVEGNYIGTKANGTDALNNTLYGVFIIGASGNTIGGTNSVGSVAGNVISGNGSIGVYITGAGAAHNLVQGNLIGTDKTGTAAIGNGTHGIYLSGAGSNTVGGTAPGVGNVISGNDSFGIYVAGSGANNNLIAGNLIGTDINGTAGLGHTWYGVYVNNVAGNTIGGTTDAARNVISSNNMAGVILFGTSATGNVVEGNYIGTKAGGAAALKNTYGVYVLGGVGNTIGGTAAGTGNVISGNSSCGVYITGSGATGNLIAGNLIGTDASGTADLGNAFYGVLVSNVAGNTIGGTTDAARNVISGNDIAGVVLNGAGTTGNVVEGNYIGTNASGTAALKNSSYGVYILSGSGNTIGGTVANAGNVISGNGNSGVYVTGSGVVNNLIAGNLIGTDKTGTLDLGNANYGVYVYNVAGNTIGGTTDLARNVISGNDLAGVLLNAAGATGNVVEGNYIGTKANGTGSLKNTSYGVVIISGVGNTIGGTAAGAGNVISGNGSRGVYVFSGTGNAVRGNAIFANGFIGIDLGATGPTANDLMDPDGGANLLQNFPVIGSAIVSGGQTTITGTLNSLPGTVFQIDLFASASANASGNWEGQTFLGSVPTIASGGDGNVSFTLVFNGDLTGKRITATATDPDGNTSEFSAAVAVPSPLAGLASSPGGVGVTTVSLGQAPSKTVTAPGHPTPVSAAAADCLLAAAATSPGWGAGGIQVRPSRSQLRDRDSLFLEDALLALLVASP